MTGSRYLLDSSAWISFMQDESGELMELLKGNDQLLLTSALSFYEIRRKFSKRGISEGLIKKALKKLRENSETVHLTGELCERAAEQALEHNLHAIDALIYESALESRAVLVTMDYDFHNLPGVKVIGQE